MCVLTLSCRHGLVGICSKRTRNGLFSSLMLEALQLTAQISDLLLRGCSLRTARWFYLWFHFVWGRREEDFQQTVKWWGGPPDNISNDLILWLTLIPIYHFYFGCRCTCVWNFVRVCCKPSVWEHVQCVRASFGVVSVCLGQNPVCDDQWTKTSSVVRSSFPYMAVIYAPICMLDREGRPKHKWSLEAHLRQIMMPKCKLKSCSAAYCWWKACSVRLDGPVFCFTSCSPRGEQVISCQTARSPEMIDSYVKAKQPLIRFKRRLYSKNVIGGRIELRCCTKKNVIAFKW